MAGAERTAALVIRVWSDPGASGFRGRVIHQADVTHDTERTVAVASREEVHAAVRLWLNAFLGEEDG